jgi:hypothetical protein
VAANLALSRSAWAYFRGKETEQQARARQLASQSRESRASLTRSAYLQAKLRCDQAERAKVVIEGGASDVASSVAGESELDVIIPPPPPPRSPGAIVVQKTTEFWLSEEELRRNSTAAARSLRRPSQDV